MAVPHVARLQAGSAPTDQNAPASPTARQDLQQFAQQHRVRVKRDGCGDEIVPGKKFCKDMPARVEYHSHVYEHSADKLGVCLLFTSARKWESAKRQMANAGFTIRQDGHTEGTALFDPANPEQVKLAFRLAGIRQKRILAPEQLARLKETAFKPSDPAQEGPSSQRVGTQPENTGIEPAGVLLV